MVQGTPRREGRQPNSHAQITEPLRVIADGQPTAAAELQCRVLVGVLLAQGTADRAERGREAGDPGHLEPFDYYQRIPVHTRDGAH